MKVNYFRYLLTLSVLLISFSGVAQKELKNKISDFGTLIPIESASIYVQNTTIGTVSNADGKFVLQVPLQFENDTLVISSIGFKSFKTPVNEFDSTQEIYLEEDIASLDEILLIAETRPQTGNDIVIKALEKLSVNMPETPYLQKGFLRHKERNRREFKWLIESAITLYDSGYGSTSTSNLKINVDQVRKSYDLRDVDSLLAYTAYLKEKGNRGNLQARNLKRDTIKTSTLIKAIKWNDTRINGLQNLFESKLNILRNVNNKHALFGEDVLDKHQFRLDTILVDNDRKIYKIEISESYQFINLETKGIYNDGYQAKGWMYIYYDNYAIKKLEYELVAASKAQKSRSKTLFDTQINHKLVMTFREYQDKMYPNYMYYETPKLVNVGYKPTKPGELNDADPNADERFYYTVQELLFTEIILDPDTIETALQKPWDPDIFAAKPYNKEFWRNYNTLLESEEDEKLIQDLTKRSSLYKD